MHFWKTIVFLLLRNFYNRIQDTGELKCEGKKLFARSNHLELKQFTFKAVFKPNGIRAVSKANTYVNNYFSKEKELAKVASFR